ncbi:alcohol dehydrogenase catalytic domain-containing protein [Streptomyces sp. NPDC001651]|uniref:alcohol dehydrogenase catalytic domain-containing protein n=1 Tax=Streptomyces sp. NPDC001651 TaxID=3364596 RepID=UPI0036829981
MADGTMHAWSVTGPGPLDGGPLRPVRKPVPVPAADELLVRVRTCGVCRTDLHVTEGDLPVRRRGVTPAHDPEAEAVPRPLPGILRIAREITRTVRAHV